ncbi:PREDICTED: uncharacterized protein LOC101309538 [Fragaria vesca subsp. vesca]
MKLLLLGSQTARELNVKKIRAIGDSNLVISQLKGDFAVKEPALAPYKTLAEKLVTSFEQISLEHIPRKHQQICRCSSYPRLKTFIHKGATNITVMQRNKPCVENMQFPSSPTPGKNDWRESIKNEMSQLHKGGRLKMLKDYSMMFGELYRCLPGGILARYIDEGEAQRRLKEIHEAICGVKQVVSLYRRLECKGYYWPRIIHPSSRGSIWILTTTESFTKWVEAIPLRKATGAAISNFIREYIVCRFRIPYKIVTDNGTPFVNQEVSATLKGYEIKYKRSTPYYPQGNGQAEATNKTLVRILSKMILSMFLGYGSEAVLPMELMIPSARELAINDLEWDAESCAKWRMMDLEAADERRRQAEAYRQIVTKAYNRTIKERRFKE